MKLNDCIIIPFPTHSDCRGNLTVIDSGFAASRLPFVPKRWFWIHGADTNAVRGEHAHRSCWEVVAAVSGSFRLTLHDGMEQKTFVLCSPSEGVVIPPMVWCRLWDFAPDTVCLTMASGEYDTDGYINDFEEFKKEAADG